MTYADKTAIREDLLAKLVPLIERLRGTLSVLHYDVQMQTWPTPPPNVNLVNTYCLVVITRGALLGEENNLSYVWSFGNYPHVPNDTALEEAVRQTFQRIGLMKLRQMQTGSADGPIRN